MLFLPLVTAPFVGPFVFLIRCLLLSLNLEKKWNSDLKESFGYNRFSFPLRIRQYIEKGNVEPLSYKVFYVTVEVKTVEFGFQFGIILFFHVTSMGRFLEIWLPAQVEKTCQRTKVLLLTQHFHGETGEIRRKSFSDRESNLRHPK